MGVRGGIRRLSRGGNMLHPKLTPWGIATMAASVVAILAAIAIGKYFYDKSKTVVGGMLPGSGGKQGIQDELGI